MQILGQGTTASQSKKLVHYLGMFTATKANFAQFINVIVFMDASTFRRVKGSCSVLLFKGTCTIKWGMPISARIVYNTIFCVLAKPGWRAKFPHMLYCPSLTP